MLSFAGPTNSITNGLRANGFSDACRTLVIPEGKRRAHIPTKKFAWNIKPHRIYPAGFFAIPVMDQNPSNVLEISRFSRGAGYVK
jgi:hypothetical protein